MHHASRRGPALRSASALLALALACAPALARAAVMDSDLVGGRPVGATYARRSLAPDLYVPSGMLATLDGRELWARDPERRRAMASTTKIMTAVVVLERAELDDVVTVSRNAAVKVGESGMNVQPGERLTVRQLLEGLLIQSGNDAAVALAEHVAGSVPAFVQLMNDRARSLDLIDTRFTNPHGLDQKGHYTSAADLTALSRYAMRDPEFRRIAATYTMKIRGSRYTHKLTSHNLLLRKYPGAIGIKTGWTDEAGYCIVAAARRGEVEFVATIMGAASETGRLGQVRRLLDWGFAHYRPATLVTQGERLGRVPVSDWIDVSVPAVAAETTAMPVFDIDGPVERQVRLKPEVAAPVEKGQPVGTVTVSQGGRLLAQLPVVASRRIEAPTVWQRIGIFFTRIWRGMFGPKPETSAPGARGAGGQGRVSTTSEGERS